MNPCYSAILALALALLTACGQTSGPAGLVLEGAWVRSPPPGATMLAAYGRLSNTGPTAVDIVDFTSDGFDEISLHETTIENGISRMKRVPAWTLEPGSELLLEPGGRHLMLVGPHRQLGPGDEIQLTIYTSSGAEYRFVVPVVLP